MAAEPLSARDCGLKESEGLRTQHLVPHDYMLIQRREGEVWIPQSIATPKTNRH